MAIVRELNGIRPILGKRCFLAENAAVIGDVKMGDDCSIWYAAVLRGDVNPIILGDRVNIQDGAVLHTLHKRSVVEIGNDVSVGHNAVIHGAKIGSNVLVGMGAIVMDNVVVPDNTVIAAGAVVLSGSVLEPGIY
ncbi:MAG: gamma carbonic anhydrase family protein, partial [Bacteroidales bacterium]|nr:gamma carbonic anhydrase family protein [Bacteroidales bacterium]